MASECRISQLRTGIECAPMDIRVIRHWAPHFRHDDYAFIFLDKFGGAIEAVCPRASSAELIGRFTLFGCYTINNYSCIETSKIQPAIDNENALGIGPVTTGEQIVDDGSIPRLFFGFCEYELLHTRIRASLPRSRDGFYPTTDYIGRLDEIPTSEMTTTNRPYMRLSLTNLRGYRVQVTLWEEVLNGEDRLAFDRAALDDGGQTVIVALTSMHVSRYGVNTLQLSSTSATYVYVNPLLPVVAEMQTHFRNEPPAIATSPRQARYNIGGHKGNIVQLLGTPRLESQNTVFTINAVVERFIDVKKWCFSKCPVCLHDIDKSGKRWLCLKDGFFDQAHHGYCVAAYLKDARASTSVTLFDSAMRTICGFSCGDLIYGQHCDDLAVLPTQILEKAGNMKLFHVQLQDDRYNTTSYTCNRVCDPTEPEALLRCIDPHTPNPNRGHQMNRVPGKNVSHKRPCLGDQGGSSSDPKEISSVAKRQLFVVPDENEEPTGSDSGESDKETMESQSPDSDA